MFWAASDVGWVVGHSYIVYAPLLTGATTVLYEGKPVGTPDAGAFWRVVAEHRVNAMFTAPTAIRAIKKEDPDGAGSAGYDLPACARCSWPASGSTRTRTRWAGERLGVPVIDHWWQTETGWPIAANPRGLEPMPIKPGSPVGAGARLRRAGARRRRARTVPPGDGRRRSCSGCRCRPAACRRCGRTTSATSRRTCRAFPGTT